MARSPGSGMGTAASSSRRRWEIALAVFCAGTVVFLVTRDLMLPRVQAVEVWLGIEVHGFWARATAPLHWALFAVGAWAFARGRAWIWPASSLYAVYVGISHLIWNLQSPNGGGLVHGVWQLLLFTGVGAVLLYLHHALDDPASEPPSEPGHRVQSG